MSRQDHEKCPRSPRDRRALYTQLTCATSSAETPARAALAGRPRGPPSREKLNLGCQLGRRARPPGPGTSASARHRHRHEHSAFATRTLVTAPHTAGARRIDPARCSNPQPARSPTTRQLGSWVLQASRRACTCGQKRCTVTTESVEAAPSPATANARVAARRSASQRSSLVLSGEPGPRWWLGSTNSSATRSFAAAGHRVSWPSSAQTLKQI